MKRFRSVGNRLQSGGTTFWTLGRFGQVFCTLGLLRMESRGQMPNPLQALAVSLAPPRLPLPPSLEGLPAVDADEIAQGLDLYIRAAAAAQRGDTPSQGEAPDAIEAAIGKAIEGRAHEAVLAY